MIIRDGKATIAPDTVRMIRLGLVLLFFALFNLGCDQDGVDFLEDVVIPGNRGSTDFWIVKADPAGNIQWQRNLGGSRWDHCSSIIQTYDGGYVVIGDIHHADGDILVNYGRQDIWIVKLDYTGRIHWQKSLGGSENDYGKSILQTTDGGYVVFGSTSSNDGDVSGYHGVVDFWVAKLGPYGNLQWQKCLGGSQRDYGYSIQQTTDGGYIVSGDTKSNDGDVSGNHGVEEGDAWVVKLDAIGDIQWQKCLGGIASDYAVSVNEMANGGYIVAGGTESNDGDVSGNHGQVDYWILELDEAGNIKWERCLGGTEMDFGFSAVPSPGGGFVAIGDSRSFDGDVSVNYGSADIWVLKLDQSGSIQWQKSLGGSDGDIAQTIRTTADGGYMIGGTTWSQDGDVSGNHGEETTDYWVVKLDGFGSVQWQKCFGGSEDEFAYDIQTTTDGGYIIAGTSNSEDGDILHN